MVTLLHVRIFSLRLTARHTHKSEARRVTTQRAVNPEKLRAKRFGAHVARETVVEPQDLTGTARITYLMQYPGLLLAGRRRAEFDPSVRVPFTYEILELCYGKNNSVGGGDNVHLPPPPHSLSHLLLPLTLPDLLPLLLTLTSSLSFSPHSSLPSLPHSLLSPSLPSLPLLLPLTLHDLLHLTFSSLSFSYLTFSSFSSPSLSFPFSFSFLFLSFSPSLSPILLPLPSSVPYTRAPTSNFQLDPFQHLATPASRVCCSCLALLALPIVPSGQGQREKGNPYSPSFLLFSSPPLIPSLYPPSPLPYPPLYPTLTPLPLTPLYPPFSRPIYLPYPSLIYPLTPLPLSPLSPNFPHSIPPPPFPSLGFLPSCTPV
ncbi:hypothetical protein C7M84_018309 [Penaeus vannamei]|uniref:Uncharacterized protein n=1 Tax=Penaeus vannamei TaxID=6689 RepID=A0A423SHY3_PENVA|nr:hypothetical protein C7M84_018309 [Penaeus vannamei]